ncbi:MAG TPA: DUF4160 domain-containing protein [Candidatus Dormibacteraeota bacterium]|nr:DUF4160 domain-containing protein [Candidatus Dormibacteraeota bacterium]
MPRISEFYGITIWMYWLDHAPPHFHAQYEADWAELTIAGRRVIRGSLPPRALRLVREWAREHADALTENWHRMAEGRAPVPIEPLR